jgi:serine/threonine-protein kinase
LIAAHLTQTAPPIRTQRPAVSPNLDALIARCMAKAPADRWQSAAELCRAFEEELARLSAPTTAGLGVAAPARRATLRWVAGMAVVLIALAVAGWVAKGKWSTASSASGEAIASIAVLPFDNASPGRENEYFSDGVAEELMVALAKGSPLRVASRSSSFAFKGRGLSAQAIGRQLGVQAVIEGSVRQSGNRLRITAQLTRVSDGLSLWSDAYDRELRDVFAVEEELSRSIVGAVRPQLLGGTPASSAGGSAFAIHGTTDPEAYLLYLRGRYFFNRRTPDGFRSAVQYFSQAIARDSGFARAWAGLADSYCIQANWRMRPSSDVCPLAKDAARHALAIDSTTAEAWASLGFVTFFYEYDVPRAQQYLRRAVALDSTYATAHLWLMQTYNALGDSASMLREIRTALRLEPLSLIMNSRYGTALMRSGRPRDAVMQLRRTLDMDPGYTDAHSELAQAYLGAGLTDSAAQQYRVIGDTIGLATVMAAAGQATEARQLLADVGVHGCAGAPEIDLVGVYDALNDVEAALRCLQAAYNARQPDVVFVSPRFARPQLAADPRFRALLRQVRASWTPASPE